MNYVLDLPPNQKWTVIGCAIAGTTVAIGVCLWYIYNETGKKSGAKEQAMAAKDTGDFYMKSGQYKLAVYSYTEAIRLCPKDMLEELKAYKKARADAKAKLDSEQHSKSKLHNYLHKKEDMQ